MLPQQPVALAGVTGEHLPLDGEDARDIDDETGRDGTAVAVDPLDGVHEVEVGDPVERRGGLPLPRDEVGQGRGEASVADQQAGHLVVAQVIDRRCGQDQVGTHPPQDLSDPPPRLVVVEDRQVAELQA